MIEGIGKQVCETIFNTTFCSDPVGEYVGWSLCGAAIVTAVALSKFCLNLSSSSSKEEFVLIRRDDPPSPQIKNQGKEEAPDLVELATLHFPKKKEFNLKNELKKQRNEIQGYRKTREELFKTLRCEKILEKESFFKSLGIIDRIIDRVIAEIAASKGKNVRLVTFLDVIKSLDGQENKLEIIKKKLIKERDKIISQSIRNGTARLEKQSDELVANTQEKMSVEQTQRFLKELMHDLSLGMTEMLAKQRYSSLMPFPEYNPV